ncbi:MAG: S41 family peptidase [Mucilaginibacter sp.]|nr:S41 family peptidase [Mucilaginibacter sp.]
MNIQKYLACMAIIAYAVIAHAQTSRLSGKTKTAVVENIAKNLKDIYVFPDTAIKMSDYIKHQLISGAYDTIKNPSVFASRLTADLRSVYPDGHLSIEYSTPVVTGNQNTDPEAVKVRRLKFRKTVNFGFEKAEILQGNIGYLKINGFFTPDSAAKTTAQAALRFISNSNTLIIDLRDNMGGDPGMVNYICGFFFPGKVHLNDLYNKKEHSTTTYWTTPDTTLNTLKNIPIYILTSHRTFSAGEELTYDLQTQKRAIIIGETTGGGAHPVSSNDAGNDFTANIPFARAINPITKTNWEKTGVKPDIEATADNALDIAIKHIASR